MTRVAVDLNDLDVLVRKELREGEVRTQHAQDVGVVDGLQAAAVAEEPGHADRVGVVVLQPLLALEGVADRSLQLQGKSARLRLGIPASVAAEDGDRVASLISPAMASRSAVEAGPMVAAGRGTNARPGVRRPRRRRPGSRSRSALARR